MKRAACGIALVAVMTGIVSAAAADMFLAPSPLGGGTAFHSRLLHAAIPQETGGSTVLKIGSIEVTPSGRLGYQRMGLNLRIPVPFELALKGSPDYYGGTLALRLPEANLWIGEGSVRAQVTPGVGVFVNGAGNVIQAYLGPRLRGVLVPNRISEWREEYLEWWEIEAGATLSLRHPLTLMAGIRWDHFDLVFRDARRLPAREDGPYRNVNLLATDVLSEVWIPFVGIGLFAANYKAYVIGSPVGLADVRVLTTLSGDIVPNRTFSEDGIVTLYKPAAFVEGRLEYQARFTPALQLGIWSKGSLLFSRGAGSVESSYGRNDPDLAMRPIEGQTVTYFRHNVGGGLSFSVKF